MVRVTLPSGMTVEAETVEAVAEAALRILHGESPLRVVGNPQGLFNEEVVAQWRNLVPNANDDLSRSVTEAQAIMGRLERQAVEQAHSTGPMHNLRHQVQEWLEMHPAWTDLYASTSLLSFAEGIRRLGADLQWEESRIYISPDPLYCPTPTGKPPLSPNQWVIPVEQWRESLQNHLWDVKAIALRRLSANEAGADRTPRVAMRLYLVREQAQPSRKHPIKELLPNDSGPCMLRPNNDAVPVYANNSFDEIQRLRRGLEKLATPEPSPHFSCIPRCQYAQRVLNGGEP